MVDVLDTSPSSLAFRSALRVPLRPRLDNGARQDEVARVFVRPRSLFGCQEDG